VAPDPLANMAARLFLGEACVEAGRDEEACGHLRPALAALESAHMPHVSAWVASHLADAELAIGNRDAARALAESVILLEVAERTGMRVFGEDASASPSRVRMPRGGG
jgi:hypothetical protein